MVLQVNIEATFRKERGIDEWEQFILFYFLTCMVVK